MNPATTRVFWVEPVNRQSLEVGRMLRVELDQKVEDAPGPGPYVVGQAEVCKDGVLKLSLTTITETGRAASALVADGILDVVLHGSTPIVRLR